MTIRQQPADADVLCPIPPQSDRIRTFECSCPPVEATRQAFGALAQPSFWNIEGRSSTGGNGSGSSGKTMSQGSSRPLTVAVPPTQQQRGLGGRAEVGLASRGVMNCPNGTTTKHEIPRSISDRQPTTTRRQSRMAHRLVRKSGGSMKAFATDILRDWIPSTAAKPLECGV